MNTKLTLSLDKKAIEKAKKISVQQGKSLSKMVEEFFNGLNGTQETNISVVEKLSGVLKGKIPAGINLKKEKGKYLKKKYGI